MQPTQSDNISFIELNSNIFIVIKGLSEVMCIFESYINLMLKYCKILKLD